MFLLPVRFITQNLRLPWVFPIRLIISVGLLSHHTYYLVICAAMNSLYDAFLQLMRRVVYTCISTSAGPNMTRNFNMFLFNY